MQSNIHVEFNEMLCPILYSLQKSAIQFLNQTLLKNIKRLNGIQYKYISVQEFINKDIFQF